MHVCVKWIFNSVGVVQAVGAFVLNTIAIFYQVWNRVNCLTGWLHIVCCSWYCSDRVAGMLPACRCICLLPHSRGSFPSPRRAVVHSHRAAHRAAHLRCI